MMKNVCNMLCVEKSLYNYEKRHLHQRSLLCKCVGSNTTDWIIPYVKFDSKKFQRISGHTVVLTSFNSKCLRLMNSWGQNGGIVDFSTFKCRCAQL